MIWLVLLVRISHITAWPPTRKTQKATTPKATSNMTSNEKAEHGFKKAVPLPHCGSRRKVTASPRYYVMSEIAKILMYDEVDYGKYLPGKV